MARLATPGSISPVLAANAVRRLAGVVLLVEDEPSVRNYARRTMELRGLTVLLAENPVEALRVSASHKGPLDVLVSDVQLPGMEGPELARRLRTNRPGLKVVFISGYSREEAFVRPTDGADAEFLQKPFTPNQLSEVLIRVLDSHDAPQTPSARPGNDAHKLPASENDTGECPSIGNP